MEINVTCSQEQDLGNVGKLDCEKPLGIPHYILLTLPTFSIADVAGLTLSALQTAIQNKEVFFFPKVIDQANSDEDDVTYTGNTDGDEIPIRDGKIINDFDFEAQAGLHANIRTFNGRRMRVVKIGENNTWQSTTPVDTKIEGMDADIRVNKMTPGDGSTPRFTRMRVEELDPSQWNDHPAVVALDFEITDLKGLRDTKMEVIGTPSATEIVVDVKSKYDNTLVRGLELADFGIDNGTLSSVDELNGRYTFVTATVTTGSILSLVDPSAMSVDGFDSSTVTITF